MTGTTTDPDAPRGRSHKNSSDGFATSLKPAAVISKTPTSLVEPKRFLVDRRTRYVEYRSPSKYNTVSTICSMTRGPASMPSLVTWPMINSAIPLDFARCVKIAEHSRTWLTLPGEEPTSVLYTTWMESTTTTSGLIFSMYSMIALRSTWFTMYSDLFSRVLSRCARRRVCFTDSSPLT